MNSFLSNSHEIHRYWNCTKPTVEISCVDVNDKIDIFCLLTVTLTKPSLIPVSGAQAQGAPILATPERLRVSAGAVSHVPSRDLTTGGETCTTSLASPLPGPTTPQQNFLIKQQNRKVKEKNCLKNTLLTGGFFWS